MLDHIISEDKFLECFLHELIYDLCFMPEWYAGRLFITCHYSITRKVHPSLL